MPPPLIRSIFFPSTIPFIRSYDVISFAPSTNNVRLTYRKVTVCDFVKVDVVFLFADNVDYRRRLGQDTVTHINIDNLAPARAHLCCNTQRQRPVSYDSYLFFIADYTSISR